MSKIYGIGDEEELAEDLQREIPDRIIKELEKIKAKIEQMDFDFGDYYDHTDTIIEMVSKVIDNHIEELKGSD